MSLVIGLAACSAAPVEPATPAEPTQVAPPVAGTPARVNSAQLRPAADMAFIESVTISADGELVAAIGRVEDDTEEVRVWRVDDGEIVTVLDAGDGRFDRIAFLDASRLVVVRGEPRHIEIVHVKVATDVFGFGWGPQDPNRDRATSIAVAPGGGAFAVGLADGKVALYHSPRGDVDTGRLLADWYPHGNQVTALAFSPDGESLASGSRDGFVRVWETSTHLQTGEIDAHQAVVTSLAWSPDGATLYSGADGLTVFNGESGFGSGTRLVNGVELPAPAAGMSTFVTWQVATNTVELSTLEDVDEITAMCVAADSGRLHVGSFRNGRGGGSVDVIEPGTDGAMRVTDRHLEDRSGTFQSVVCTPDGRVIVSSLREIAAFEGESGEVVWTHGF